MPRITLAEHLTVSFSKVAEFQRRGVVHFHALIRLDGPGDGYPAPGLDVTTDQLRDAIIAAAAAASVTTDPYAYDSPTWLLRFGGQIEVRPVHGQANRDAAAGPMHPEMVAAYIAKYATKAADDFGLTAHRLDASTDLARLPVSDHVRRLLAMAVHMSAASARTIDILGNDADALGDDDTDNAALIEVCRTWARLVRWLHMLGFRGHFATKSRRYSVTLGRLRAERRTWRRRHEATHRPSDTDELDDSTLVVVREWAFDGAGWLTTGDAALAASAAARAREHRDAARLD